MSKTSKNKTPTQRERFIQAAREVGADEREEVFERVLKKVASASPPKDEEKRKSKKPAK